MKRLGGVLALLLLASLLGGCFGAEELNKIAAVFAIGVDAAPGGVEVAVQVVRPGAVSNSTGGSAAASGQQVSATFVLKAAGRDLADALSRLQAQVPRRLSFSQVQLVVFGEKVARQSIAPALDFLARNRQFREDTDIAFTHEDVARLLATPIALNPISAQGWKALIDARIVSQASLVEIGNALVSGGKDPFLPIIGTKPVVTADTTAGGGGAGERSNAARHVASVMGTALFQRDRYVGDLSLDEARGLNWLVNQTPKALATVTVSVAEICRTSPCRPVDRTPATAAESEIARSLDDRGPSAPYVSVILLRGNTRIRLVGPELPPHFLVTMNDIDDLSQDGAGFDVTDSEVMERLKRTIARNFIATVERDLAIFKRLKVDPVGFGAVIKEREPRLWRKVHDHWHDVIPSLIIDVDAKLAMSRPGLALRPYAYLERELIR